MFSQELKEPPANLSSKNKKIRDKVDSIDMEAPGNRLLKGTRCKNTQTA